MYAKAKGQQMPSDIQAKEKLAHYVYEYLMHIGAKQSAQVFLQEIRWDKNVALGEAPGFLSSWWCVFWDLYCAAPERRGQYEASEEAKIFHDYAQPPQSANPMMMPGQPPFGRFHPSQRGMKMPPNVDFNSANNVQQQNSNNLNPSANVPQPPNNNSQMNFDANRVNASMSPMNRLTPPGRVMNNPHQPVNPQQQQNIGNLGYNCPPQVGNQQIRGSNQNPQQQPNSAPMSPMPMNLQQQQQRWSGPNQQNSAVPTNQGQPQLPPPASTMGYTSSSPAPYVSNQQQINPHGPGTPIAPSPSQDTGDLSFSLNKIVPSGIQFHDQNFGANVNMGSDISHHSQINGEIMDSLKNSPITNLPGGNRHHDETGPIADLNPYSSFGDANLF